jgi:hypothetical protein
MVRELGGEMGRFVPLGAVTLFGYRLQEVLATLALGVV